MNILDLINQLEEITDQLKTVQYKKDCLVEQIALALNAPEDKSKTFKVDGFKIEVKRGRNYKIDIEKYLELDLSDDINPIKIVKKYEVNKQKLAVFEEKYGNIYSEFLSYTPAKLAITVKEIKNV